MISRPHPVCLSVCLSHALTATLFTNQSQLRQKALKAPKKLKNVKKKTNQTKATMPDVTILRAQNKHISDENKPQRWTEGNPEAPRRLKPAQRACGMEGIVASADAHE